MSIFAIWTSQAASKASAAADVATTLSYDYSQVAVAVAAEESLDRKYRLTPKPKIRASFQEKAGELDAALMLAARDGDHTDQARVKKLMALHHSHVAGNLRIFTAVDNGHTATIPQLEEALDPQFKVIEETVDLATETQHRQSVTQLAYLRNLERVNGRLTPFVFLLALLLAAMLTLITRVHRRLLETERSLALHVSMHDALTGLPNRILLGERFGQALLAAKRSGTTVGLLLIDLDRFKEVNDTFGHHYGDLLLAQIGSRLRLSLREVDTVSRLGGDEFAVLLPDVAGLSAAVELATRLRGGLEAPFLVEEVALDVEASIGLVLSGEHGMDPTLLMQRADIAMYIAKSHHLGVSVYDPEVDGHSPAKLALLGELRSALNRGELVLHYQPKVSVTTGEVVGAEALVRWQHPERGLIYPDAFIPLAEETGLIGPLTTFVLGAALAQARTWIDSGLPLLVSVNLSARNLLDEHLPEQVAELLATHGVPADLLELEVTETALMTEPNRARRLLEALAAVGVRLSIDDFGAGYTSLGQLKDLPIDELKIDKSFIINMGDNPSDVLIVNSIVDLGHNLGLTIVAAGVETPAALKELTSFSCDVAQGYYLARPVPPGVFDAWRLARSSGARQPLNELSHSVQDADAAG